MPRSPRAFFEHARLYHPRTLTHLFLADTIVRNWEQTTYLPEDELEGSRGDASALELSRRDTEGPSSAVYPFPTVSHRTLEEFLSRGRAGHDDVRTVRQLRRIAFIYIAESTHLVAPERGEVRELCARAARASRVWRPAAPLEAIEVVLDLPPSFDLMSTSMRKYLQLWMRERAVNGTLWDMPGRPL
jgi:hypothetical protein